MNETIKVIFCSSSRERDRSFYVCRRLEIEQHYTRSTVSGIPTNAKSRLLIIHTSPIHTPRSFNPSVKTFVKQRLPNTLPIECKISIVELSLAVLSLSTKAVARDLATSGNPPPAAWRQRLGTRKTIFGARPTLRDPTARQVILIRAR